MFGPDFISNFKCTFPWLLFGLETIFKKVNVALNVSFALNQFPSERFRSGVKFAFLVVPAILKMAALPFPAVRFTFRAVLRHARRTALRHALRTALRYAQRT